MLRISHLPQYLCLGPGGPRSSSGGSREKAGQCRGGWELSGQAEPEGALGASARPCEVLRGQGQAQPHSKP